MNILTGNKDTDLLILDNLDDKSLINFCLVNKEANRLCSIDSFWRNRLVRKYGEESLQFKSPERTWKQFYLSILKYWDDRDDMEESMLNAAEAGDKDLVDFFISKGADDWDSGMESAAEGGHKDLVDFFISKGANWWDWGMNGAARGGHKDLVDFFISKASDWGDSTYYAALEGHKDIIELFISKGINEHEWDMGKLGAIKGGHEDLIDLFQKIDLYE